MISTHFEGKSMIIHKIQYIDSWEMGQIVGAPKIGMSVPPQQLHRIFWGALPNESVHQAELGHWSVSPQLCFPSPQKNNHTFGIHNLRIDSCPFTTSEVSGYSHSAVHTWQEPEAGVPIS